VFPLIKTLKLNVCELLAENDHFRPRQQSQSNVELTKISSARLEYLKISSSKRLPVTIADCAALRYVNIQPIEKLLIQNCPKIQTLIVDITSERKFEIQGYTKIQKLQIISGSF
jgi:hypothetical protein